MGYTTWFEGEAQFNKPVTDELMDKINNFADERHEGQEYPGYWCQWIIDEDSGDLIWDGGEKFYCYDEWLRYLIKHFFEPEGYILNGIIKFQGEDSDDFGELQIVDNVVTVEYGIHAQTLTAVSDDKLIAECKRRKLM